MDHTLKGALLANASSLGFHWLYNTNYLRELSKTESLLFQTPNKKHYDQAGNSYFAYPNAKVGDVTTQGMFLIWLNDLYQKQDFVSKKDYEMLIYENIKPGGSYQGYIESYGKKLIYTHLIDELGLKSEKPVLDDNHLVGFIPYLVGRTYNQSNDKAFELASIFTSDHDYVDFYLMFDYIFEHIEDKDFNKVLEQSIVYAPKSFHEKLYQAIKMDDTDRFILNHAGISCHIPYSIPLLMHILSHTNSFEEMLKFNVSLGGASSDRALILGALLQARYGLPNEYQKIKIKEINER